MKPDKIEAAMRYVYAHFLDEGDTLDMLVTSRKMLYARARHALRARIYQRYACTLAEIGRAEGAIKDGKPTDHSTIGDSVKIVEDGTIHAEAIAQIDILLAEFEEYWISLQHTGPRARLAKYHAIPHHVLVVIIAFAEEFGWADPVKLDGLHREFSTVSRKFVKDQIKKAE